jgi:hypothetical protein
LAKQFFANEFGVYRSMSFAVINKIQSIRLIQFASGLKFKVWCVVGIGFLILLIPPNNRLCVWLLKCLQYKANITSHSKGQKTVCCFRSSNILANYFLPLNGALYA